MGVVTVKSAAITNRDGSPPVLNNAAIVRADLKEMVAVVGITSGDSVASKYILGSLPSNARLSQTLLYAPDIGTTTAFDLGLYRTTQEGGAVVDVDFIASGQALSSGPYVGVDIGTEAAAAGGLIANGEKRIWEALGLTADPMLTYDLVMTLTGAADAGGTVKILQRWTE